MITIDTNADRDLQNAVSHWQTIVEKFTALRQGAKSLDLVQLVEGETPDAFEVDCCGRRIRLEVVVVSTAERGPLGQVLCSIVRPAYSDQPNVFMTFEVTSSGQTNFVTPSAQVVWLGQAERVAHGILAHVVAQGLRVDTWGGVVPKREA